MKNKTVLITGATSGIGYEIIKELSLNNQILVIVRDKHNLGSLNNTLRNIKIYEADLSSLEEVENICEEILDEHSKLDILINNAAVQYETSFLDINFKIENLKKEINTNFTSVCILTYKLLPLLQESQSPSILNVNSGLAIVPKRSSAVYSASKAALNSMSLTLRNQFEDTNILVQQIFFELVETSMSKNRGKNKLSASNAALKVIYVLEKKILDYDVGKVKFLRLLNRLVPFIARKIMKRS